MPRLEWDKTGERLYETGTRMGVLYPLGSGSYLGGVAWNGLTSVSESPSGADANAIYADDIKYLELRGREEFGGTIEAYTYPDEWADCDGSAELSGGVTIGQQVRKPFGLCYHTVIGNDVARDDYGYKLHLVYNATASPSEKSYQTINDSPEAISFSWEFTTTPIEVTGYRPASQITIDSTKVNPENLKVLEDILYGTSLTFPRLPLPSEVITVMSADYDDFNGVRLYSKGMELDGPIGLDYYLEVCDDSLYDGGRAIVTFDGTDSQTNLSDLEVVSIGGKSMRLLHVSVPAKNMRDTMHINVMASGGGSSFENVPLRDILDTDITGGIDYSVAEYLQEIARSSDKKAAKLAASIDNFGKCVQKIVNYKASEVEPDTALFDYVTTDTVSDYQSYIQGSISVAEDAGASMVYGDAVGIKFYFETSVLPSLEVCIDNIPMTPEAASGNEYYVQTSSILPVNFTKMYEFDLKYNSELYFKMYGVFSYCYGRLSNPSASVASKNIAKALYDYYAKTIAYLG